MKNIKFKEIGYEECMPTKYEKYVQHIKVILEHTDQVCFTVYSYKLDLKQFCARIDQSLWASLRENVLYTTCDQAIIDIREERREKSDLIVMKNNERLVEFFLARKNMFDFEEYDPIFDISLQNPVFIKDGEVICYTLSHEDICYVAKDVYETIPQTKYVAYVPDNHETYLKFVREVLADTEEVSFVAKPYLSDIFEFYSMIQRCNWTFLSQNEVFISEEVEDKEGIRGRQLIVKKNRDLVEFFFGKENIFDYDSKDVNTGITLENPEFMEDGEVICYTVTSEKTCYVSEEIYQKM